MGRFLLSAGAGILGFIISYAIFKAAYINWAVWRYPHNNSMAGLAALIYGFPVGAICGLLVFGFVYYAGRSRSGVSS